jgi:hypothetical protein
MTIPALTVFQDGPLAVSADQLNTFVQTAQVAAQLRTITGAGGMCVLLQGIATAGDGLGGFFFWSPTSTLPDDNLDTLVPPGTLQGGWLRLTMKVTQ